MIKLKRSMNIWFMAVLFCFAGGALNSALGNEFGVIEFQNSDPAYTLGAEDQIKITVFGEDDLSGVYKLDGNGFISMPLVGELDLKQMTLRDTEIIIEAELSDGYLIDPSVSVEVAKHRPFYILGEVRVPGRYDYISNMNVFSAVALAGGFTYRANQKRVKIMASKGDDPASSKNRDVTDRVYPGEVIIVRERFF